MLYFSETDWTLPDIAEVNDEFGRDYDQDDYEKKIGRVISDALKQPHQEGKQSQR